MPIHHEKPPSRFTWNHRVIRRPSGLPDAPWMYQIHEVHYEDGVIVGYTANPVVVSADSISELRLLNEQISAAWQRPVLRECPLRILAPVREDATE